MRTTQDLLFLFLFYSEEYRFHVPAKPCGHDPSTDQLNVSSSIGVACSRICFCFRNIPSLGIEGTITIRRAVLQYHSTIISGPNNKKIAEPLSLLWHTACMSSRGYIAPKARPSRLFEDPNRTGGEIYAENKRDDSMAQHAGISVIRDG